MVGYPVKNVHSIERKYICPQCQLILREPYQSMICAHRICQSCLEEEQRDMFTCAECNEQLTKDKLKLDRGCKNDMKLITIECILCDWTGMLKDYQSHLDDEHLKPKCDYCGNQFLTVYDLINHQKIDCSQITVVCPLYSLGCQQNILQRDLVEHFRSEEHQIAILHFIQLCYQQKSSHSTKEYRKIIEKLWKLLNDVNKLTDNTKQIRNEFNQTNSRYLSTNETVTVIQQLNNEQNAFVQEFIAKQELMLTNILNAKDKSKELLYKMNEGFFIWKIDNISEKLDAESYLESSSFYSSPTGYEMRLRLYLNGDDKARNTHISIHFVLIRGEYDPILRFPFCFPIIICLYNQIDPKKHAIHRILPDGLSKSEYFRRPQSIMNTPYPISQFAPRDSLRQEDNNPFIRDNTIFIKTFLEFSKIQNELLEEMSGINPMYPVETQQQTIFK